MHESTFPPDTLVRVTQTMRLRTHTTETQVSGVVDSWETKPTASWYTHDPGGRLVLERLTLRKPDGELSVIVVDDSTSIARIEAGSPGG